jgi:kynurenine formamidase
MGWGAQRGLTESYLRRWPCEPSHHALLDAGVLIIEELRIPEAVWAGERFFLTAFPILLEGCGGAWTRAVAWPLDEDGAGR